MKGGKILGFYFSSLTFGISMDFVYDPDVKKLAMPRLALLLGNFLIGNWNLSYPFPFAFVIKIE